MPDPNFVWVLIHFQDCFNKLKCPFVTPVTVTVSGGNRRKAKPVYSASLLFIYGLYLILSHGPLPAALVRAGDPHQT